MKKIGRIIFIIICVLIVITSSSLIIQNRAKEKSKQKETNENFEVTKTKTKNGEEVETEYIRIEDNKFYLKIPINFKQLEAREMRKRYKKENRPSITFSNEEKTISIEINMTDIEIKNDKIKEYTKKQQESFQENSEIISTKNFKVDNHNIGEIKRTTKEEEIELYKDIIFFSYNDKLITITFNCIKELQDSWQQVGNFIIDSLLFLE